MHLGDERSHIFERLYKDGKEKDMKYLDYQNKVKFEEQLQWFKTLKDKKLLNPDKQLSDLIVKLTAQKMQQEEEANIAFLLEKQAEVFNLQHDQPEE